MEVYIEITNKYGIFKSDTISLSVEEYESLLEQSKSFYKSGAGFEMYLPDGFIVLPPSILSESILKIKIQNNE